MKESISIANLSKEIERLKKNMVTREQLNQALETMAILSNENTMKQIRASEEDIKAGRVEEVTSIKDLLE